MLHKKIFVLLRIVLLIIALSNLTITEVFSSDTLIVEKHGQLRVKGNKIVDQFGNPVALHGMSLFWSQWIGKYYNYDCMQWLRDDWNCTVVRAACGINNFTDGYLVNPQAELAKIRTVIDACIDLGIYVLVDWHDDHAQNHLSQSISFFKEIANDYTGLPNIIYEIYNEPYGSTSWSSVVKPYADSVIKQIRAIDSINLIIVGTPTWSQDVDIASYDPLPYNNVAYTLHFYAATHKQALRNKATTALNNGIALFVTEWGTCESSGTGVLDSAEVGIWSKFMNDHMLSWCNWAIEDKLETAAALIPGASARGGWSGSDLTKSGVIVRKMLLAWQDPIYTSVERAKEMPMNFELHQNYPNPFNPSTTIEYQIPNGGTQNFVSLRVYDLLGREVAVLVSKEQLAGKYNIIWNASNIPNGVYFYRLSVVPIAQRDLVPTKGRNWQARSFADTKKLILIK
jgi:endoglucanase